jgi:large subunit ribosomal protein L6e
VNQRYVIATSTKVSLNGVNSDAVTDATFAREARVRATGEEALFAAATAPAPASERLTAARKAAQTSVDTALLANVNKVEFLAGYLSAKFSLSKGDRPHMLQF